MACLRFTDLQSRPMGTHLRRDTFIPQWVQASKAAAASDRHAVHFGVTAVVFQLSRLRWIPEVGTRPPSTSTPATGYATSNRNHKN